MNIVIIHPQQSVQVLLMQLISKLKKNDVVSVFTSPKELNTALYCPWDIFFVKLENTESIQKLMIEQPKCHFVSIGHTQQICRYQFSDTNIRSLNILGLLDQLEQLFDDIESSQKVLPVTYQQNIRFPKTADLIVIGSSTGGPAVLQEVLHNLPQGCPPILIAQHMPRECANNLKDFFKGNLNNEFNLVNNTKGHLQNRMYRGNIYMARAGYDVEVIGEKDGYYVAQQPIDMAPVHPSINRLFTSVAKLRGSIICIVMTGMGKDGMIGAKALKTAGHFVIAQEPTTCVVDGMPRAIIETDCADAILTPSEIQHRLIVWTINQKLGL
jgi:chemotaxis response regulator CheB